MHSKQACLFNWTNQVPTLKELLLQEPRLPEREIITRALDGKVKLTHQEIEELHCKSSQHGQFFTPEPIADLMAFLAELRSNDSVIDPACGIGNLMLPCLKYTSKVYGIELVYDTAELASKVLKLNITRDNTLEHPPTEKYDVVIANPPFGVIGRGSIENWESFELNRNENKIRGKNQSEILFLELCLKIAKRRVVIIMPDSFCANDNTKFAREWLLNKFGYRSTIALPDKTFWKSARTINKWTTPTTGTHASICVIDKVKPEGNYNIFMSIMKSLDDASGVKEAWAKFRGRGELK